jgi:hypothetical protein
MDRNRLWYCGCYNRRPKPSIFWLGVRLISDFILCLVYRRDKDEGSQLGATSRYVHRYKLVGDLSLVFRLAVALIFIALPAHADNNNSWLPRHINNSIRNGD